MQANLVGHKDTISRSYAFGEYCIDWDGTADPFICGTQTVSSSEVVSFSSSVHWKYCGGPVTTGAVLYKDIKLFFIYCIVQLGFLPWEIQVASLGKDSCDRVALPNLRCMLGVSVGP